MRSLHVGSLLIEGGLPQKKSASDFPDTALLLNLTTEIPAEIPAKLSSNWSTLLGYPAGKMENTPPELQVWMIQPSPNQLLLSFPPTRSDKKSAPHSPESAIAESLLQRIARPQSTDPQTLFSVRIENPSALTSSPKSELLASLNGPVEFRLQNTETNTNGIRFVATLELPNAIAAKRSRRILDGIAATAAASAPKKLATALDEKLDIRVEEKTVRVHADFSAEEMISLAKQALESQDESNTRRSQKKSGASGKTGEKSDSKTPPRSPTPDVKSPSSGEASTGPAAPAHERN
jgi:hypothetical protein